MKDLPYKVEAKHPDCLGDISARYGGHCSSCCPYTALCVLVAIGTWQAQKSAKEREA